jgi:hypothetical protein
MGFFNKVKKFAGKALGAVGGVVRRIGDVGGKAVKVVGALASPLHNVVNGVTSLIPGGALVGGLLNKGVDYLGGQAAQKIAGKVAGFGSKLQNVSEDLSA